MAKMRGAGQHATERNQFRCTQHGRRQILGLGPSETVGAGVVRFGGEQDSEESKGESEPLLFQE